MSPHFWATIYLILRDIDKVDELMADITEQQEVAQQISDAISRPMGFGDDVDEVIGSEELGILEKACLGKSWGGFGVLQKWDVFGSRIFLSSS